MRESAEQGDVKTQLRIGLLDIQRRGLWEDYGEATSWT